MLATRAEGSALAVEENAYSTNKKYRLPLGGGSALAVEENAYSTNKSVAW